MSDIPSRTKLGTCINVRGTSGSGKTTFAGDLARILNFRHVELDSLFWGPNWTESPDEIFFARITEATAGVGWVVDGNYTRTRSLYWPRLNTVIFLDYPRWFVMWRVISRTFRRSLRGVELWQGNRERLSNALFSKDSIFRWSWNTYARRRAQFTELEGDPANAHIHFIRLQTPQEARRFLQSLAHDT
ncbi:MAG: adenylate kinase [Anaerolineae bacterium]|nr:MAG: adenylate kinase [Anaerolineae bacterium]